MVFRWRTKKQGEGSDPRTTPGNKGCLAKSSGRHGASSIISVGHRHLAPGGWGLVAMATVLLALTAHVEHKAHTFE